MSTAARIDELRKKFDENPRRYFAPLANEYRKAGELALAIALCREHLPKQPGHMSGHIVFGQALFENGDLAEARVVFENALALDPENLIALRHLGDIAKATGDAPAARRWYERVLDADPRNDDIAAQLATLATGLTPPSVPAMPATPAAMPTPAAGTPGVPAFAMPPLPTPDSAMRAVDFDAVNQQIARFQPLDLDAMDAAAPVVSHEDEEPAQTVPHAQVQRHTAFLDIEPTALADTGSAVEVDATSTGELPMQSAFESSDNEEASDALPSGDAPDGASAGTIHDRSAHDGETEPAAAASPETEAVDPIVTGVSDDHDGRSASPGAGVHQGDPARDSQESGGSGADVEDFEEGLIAPVWPDTTPFVTRLQTPRAGTPGGVAAYPSPDTGARDRRDAPDAFGREPHEIPRHGPAEEPPVSLDGDHGSPTGVRDAATEDAHGSTEMTTPERYEIIDEAANAGDDREETHDDSAGSAAPAPGEQVPETANEDAPHHEWLAEDADPHRALADDELPVEAQQGSPVAEVGRPVSAEIEAIADAFTADAREVGEADDVVLAEYEPAPEPAVSFADVHPAADAEVEESEEAQREEAADQDAVGAFGHQEAEAAEVEAESVSAEAPAFVTETMGELLVSQGLIDRAVTVYEELVRRRPYDPVLSSRLDELRARLAGDAAVETRTATPARSAPAMPTPGHATPRFATPQHAPSHPTPRQTTPWIAAAVEEAPAGGSTARELFARLAARRVPRRTPPQPVASVPSSQAPDAAEANLSALFGSVPAGEHDDAAARALADAFAPIPPQNMSGQGMEHDFARAFLSPESAPSAPFAADPPRPSSVSTTTSTPTPRGGAFSFDRFFPDPATPAAPESGTASTGASAKDPASASAPVDDLAEFSAWLKGLGKS